jgi:hypothetical protein
VNIKELIEKLQQYSEETDVLFDVSQSWIKSESSIACTVDTVSKGFMLGMHDNISYVMLSHRGDESEPE